MVSKIVVGVDSTPTAAAAADRAATLAAALGAELHVVTAFGKPEVETVEVGTETFIISSRDEADQLTGSVAAKLNLAHPQLKVLTRALQGKPAQAMIDAAEEIGADMVVIGNKRVQGPSRVLGSIATAVLHKAPCDVYVVHTHGS